MHFLNCVAVFLLYLLFHKSVFVTVDVKISSASEIKTGFGVAFGVEFHKLHSVGGYVAHKRNVMLLGHIVINRNKMLVLYPLDIYLVVLVGIFGFKGWQSDSATTYNRVPYRSYNISANGTNIKFRPHYIG